MSIYLTILGKVILVDCLFHYNTSTTSWITVRPDGSFANCITLPSDLSMELDMFCSIIDLRGV